MKSLTYRTFLGMLFTMLNCQNPARQEYTDVVKLSQQFQSWETTEKPNGSAAYLGLGPYAKCLCTAVFVSGRTPEEFAAHNDAIILEKAWVDSVRYQVDEATKQVTAYLGDTVFRTATFVGDQGCILDVDKGLHFTPGEVPTSLPLAETMEWPMGDRTPAPSPVYDAVNLNLIAQAAFAPQALTAALLVIHHGQIILERYADGIDKDTQLESWSMGKSVTGTLIGRLIRKGKLSLDEPAPVPEWQQEGDPRGAITIRNLMQMSSGLRFPSFGRTRDSSVAGSTSYDGELPLAQLTHVYPYTGSINVFEFAVNRPLEFTPGSKGAGQYRNCDPLTLGYIIRRLVEAEGRIYWTWPQEELFDRIGIRKQLLETDRWGNFIMTGYDFGTARNWGRLALLYLQDGVWQGERLLPEGFVDFVSTPAPAWIDPVYGGMFWLNTDGKFEVPKDAYAMLGGGGQHVIMVPSLDLAIVRLGHSKGAKWATAALNEALRRLVTTLPKN
ncbi:MAG: serine hydrolase [Saprospiraceae bacterium]|nr:serine hydrolase [Saprospiraceae bacterium]